MTDNKKTIYALVSIKVDFVFCKNENLEIVMNFANEISRLQKQESFFGVLNNLQLALCVPTEHKKYEFPVYLLNIVLKDYGLKII